MQYKSIASLDIDRLKLLAFENPLRRARICAHDSTLDSIQQMIIVLHHTSIVEMHRHPTEKFESYLILEGALKVEYEDLHGSSWNSVFSRDTGLETSIYGRHGQGLWHKPIPLTEWVVYLETYDGPFNKELDVEYR